VRSYASRKLPGSVSNQRRTQISTSGQANENEGEATISGRRNAWRAPPPLPAGAGKWYPECRCRSIRGAAPSDPVCGELPTISPAPPPPLSGRSALRRRRGGRGACLPPGCCPFLLLLLAAQELRLQLLACLLRFGLLSWACLACFFLLLFWLLARAACLCVPPCCCCCSTCSWGFNPTSGAPLSTSLSLSCKILYSPLICFTTDWEYTCTVVQEQWHFIL
jgi:hypothetical protein